MQTQSLMIGGNLLFQNQTPIMRKNQKEDPSVLRKRLKDASELLLGATTDGMTSKDAMRDHIVEKMKTSDVQAWLKSDGQHDVAALLWWFSLQNTTETDDALTTDTYQHFKAGPLACNASQMMAMLEEKPVCSKTHFMSIKAGFSVLGRSHQVGDDVNLLNPLKASCFDMHKWWPGYADRKAILDQHDDAPVPPASLYVAQMEWLQATIFRKLGELSEKSAGQDIVRKLTYNSQQQLILAMAGVNLALAVSLSRVSRGKELCHLTHTDLTLDMSHQEGGSKDLPLAARAVARLLQGDGEGDGIEWPTSNVEQAHKGKSMANLPKQVQEHYAYPEALSRAGVAGAVELLVILELAFDPERHDPTVNPNGNLFNRRDKDGKLLAVDSKTMASWMVKHRPGQSLSLDGYKIVKWFGTYGSRRGYAREAVASDLHLNANMRHYFGHAVGSKQIRRYADNRTEIRVDTPAGCIGVKLPCGAWSASVDVQTSRQKHYRDMCDRVL